jgi:hypothetical protein
MLRTAKLFDDYTIREDGRITNKWGRVIAHRAFKGEYVRVKLKSRLYNLHRLLALAFIPNPENKPEINHIDGNKHNPALGNLEWVTSSENQYHAFRTGLRKGYHVSGRPLSDAHKKALCGSRWKYDDRTYNIEGSPFRNLKEIAASFGVCRQTALNRCLSKKWPDWSVSKSAATHRRDL